ncbi:hypothetical protein [Bosea minatitlanensis]|uniref:Uncharacterized protein n=1 Tax=Bosea minatitlanensis TaxID=128782 RepID=A0ABW0F376_9HYPH|nr:hypothetical protein [Bosea minatitlanensis]MCT4492702.1 hypothetical protein [Bosea minatitlanensis]
MIDHLLRFDDEAAALAAFPDLHGEDGWSGEVLRVGLVTADAVFGEDDGDGAPILVSPAQTKPGFWLLAATAGLPGEVAAIERASGRIVAGDTALAGVRLDPVWAGAEPLLSLAAPGTEPQPALAAISDRQFAQQLAVLGAISEAEALAWAARGELPAAIEAAVDALPEEQRFGARMLLASATTYERGHPLVAALADLLGYDAGAVDDLWRAAVLL